MSDYSTEVLVIGFGFAGAVAAIEAHDAGAAVAIVEKQPEGGGNSILSAGNFAIVRPGASSDFTQYIHRLNLGMTPLDVFQAYTDGSGRLADWFELLGGKAVPRVSAIIGTFPGVVEGHAFPKVAPAKKTFDIRIADGDQEIPPAMRLWSLLQKNLQARKIKVYRSAAARRIVRDSSGRVCGADVEIGGESVRFRASRAVVLASGGFENNPEMLTANIPSKPIYFAGSPGNTGDGVRMAQELGAATWHMAQTATLIGFKADEFEAAFCIFFRRHGFIYVDTSGKRFIDETSIELHDFDRVFSAIDPHTISYPRNPSWGIFNKATLDAGPLTWSIAGYNRNHYKWSHDNRDEIERGWIIEAETIEQLADRTGLPTGNLERTISGYNDGCNLRGQLSVYRDPKTMEPLDPPYYAIQLRPVLVNTQGGPRRDASARILAADGSPIPRLYGAGELGSIWGPFYDGAGNVTECLVFGRIAGGNAARETDLQH